MVVNADELQQHGFMCCVTARNTGADYNLCDENMTVAVTPTQIIAVAMMFSRVNASPWNRGASTKFQTMLSAVLQQQQQQHDDRGNNMCPGYKKTAQANNDKHVKPTQKQ